jgi:hypothetical protein
VEAPDSRGVPPGDRNQDPRTRVVGHVNFGDVMIRPVFLLTTAALAVGVDVEPAKLMTADAAPLEPGAIELAIGVIGTTADANRDGAGERHDRGGTYRERSSSIGVTYGLVEGLDVGLGAGWSWITDDASEPRSGSGAMDIEFGAKWRFWHSSSDDASWALAVLPGIGAPMGRDQREEVEIATASRCWSAALAIAGSGHMGIMAFNADAGGSRNFGDEAERGGCYETMAVNTAIGVQISEDMQPEIEMSWNRDHMDQGPDPWSMTLTAGLQIALPCGRLGLGLQRVVAGADVDVTTSCIVDLALAIE